MLQRNLKLVCNISEGTRQNLEIVRAFLMMHSPLHLSAGMAEAIEFLLDNAPIQEMIDFIGAKHKEKVRLRNEYAASDEFTANVQPINGNPVIPAKRKRGGRPKKQSPSLVGADKQG